MNTKNRYYLAIDEGTVSVSSEITKVKDDCIKLHSKLKRVNSNDKSECLYSKPVIKYFYKILYNSYLKLRLNQDDQSKKILPSSLQDIDKFTTKFKNESELRSAYKNLDGDKIVVVYRVGEDVKNIPVVYEEDKDLLDVMNLRKEFCYSCSDIAFLNRLFENRHILSHLHYSIVEFNKLEEAYKERQKDPDYPINTPAINFFIKFVYIKGQINYLNLRLLADLIINYRKPVVNTKVNRTLIVKTKEESLDVKTKEESLNVKRKKNKNIIEGQINMFEYMSDQDNTLKRKK